MERDVHALSQWTERTNGMEWKNGVEAEALRRGGEGQTRGGSTLAAARVLALLRPSIRLHSSNVALN